MEDTTRSAASQARRLGNVYEHVALLLRQPGTVHRLNEPRGEQDWSAMQIIGHMAEMIPYWLAHCHMLIATAAEVPQFGRLLDASERLEGVERGATGNPDEIMGLLQTEIHDAVTAIRSMSPAQRSKKGIHIRRGEMTVTEIIEVFLVAHGEEHVEQLRAALRA